MEYSACLGRPVGLESIRHLNDRPPPPVLPIPIALLPPPFATPLGQWQHLAQHQLKLQKN